MTTDAADQPTVSFVHLDDLPFVEAKAQQHGDRRVGVHIQFMELQPDRSVFHTRYDPGLVLERHGHHSNHYIFVISGEVTFDEELCRSGSLVKLPLGATFGPIVVGDEGAEILEIYYGDCRPVPAGGDAHRQMLADRDIQPLPNPPLDLPEWFGERTDSEM